MRRNYTLHSNITHSFWVQQSTRSHFHACWDLSLSELWNQSPVRVGVLPTKTNWKNISKCNQMLISRCLLCPFGGMASKSGCATAVDWFIFWLTNHAPRSRRLPGRGRRDAYGNATEKRARDHCIRSWGCLLHSRPSRANLSWSIIFSFVSKWHLIKDPVTNAENDRAEENRVERRLSFRRVLRSIKSTGRTGSQTR